MFSRIRRVALVMTAVTATVLSVPAISAPASKKLQADALAAIKNVEGLKDPSSVQIRKVVAAKQEHITIVCGEYNAKNSYGAYVGFKPFFAMISGNREIDMAYLGSEDTTALTAVQMCEKYGAAVR